MKVAIFGSYNGGSIGDTAILLGLISSVFRVLGDDVEITVLALGTLGINSELEELGGRQRVKRVKEVAIYRKVDYSFLGVEKFLNKGWRVLRRLRGRVQVNERRIRSVLNNSDVLLVGGGNLVMDLYKNWPKLLKLVCSVSKDVGVPYSFIGVGSAPINTLQGKNDLLYSLKSAKSVYFRDLTSKKYTEDHLGFEKSAVGPDLAFGIDSPQLTQADKENVLMLNLAAVYSRQWPVKDPDKYDNYLSNMVVVVDRLVESLSIKELVIFNTNYPLDETAAEDFIKKYKSSSNLSVSLNFIRGRNTVSRLLDICSKAKFSLVTRLHAGIISKISGAHVLAIEYQPKVKDVLENQTSHTIVESLDAVLSGIAFETVDQDYYNDIRSERNCVSHGEVDELIRLVFKESAAKVI
ncbi:polysaccharide pyruvyl transferase family protein [Halomonas sp. KAO]|uniref:polysaccharide pyruvyl transferase family protein n=1 Tax=Halomonas sp. KAO TaxID=2783858 RepID=UPI00189FC667|nr:polysaccharide pyruvyl transferase family protein [Halomonas sp. KAO]MBF7052531.1 polysaccharide pyruvyl transferase family protein [Halomonas sp. KAO]